MKHISLLCLSFLLFLNIRLYAQNETFIFGTVKDPDTNEKIAGANVRVDSIGGVGVVTGNDGKYRLKLDAGQHKITFSFTGYLPVTKTITVKEGDSKQVNAGLIVQNKELNTVVVTGSQYEKKLSQETISMDVLSKDLIKSTNSRDLGELLAKDPGITNMDGQISIRGGSSYSYGVGSRTAVMVDGQSYMSADLGEAQLKFAPIEDAEQVEVIKGASSVIYGSSALDGVVNMVTAWPKSTQPKFDVSVYSGVYTDFPNKSLEWWNKSQLDSTGKPINDAYGRAVLQGKKPRGYMGTNFSYKQKIKNLQLVIGANLDGIASYLQAANEFRGRGNFKTKYVLPKNPFISFGINGNVMFERSGRYFLSKSLTPDSAYLISNGSFDQYIRTELNPHFTYQDDRGNRFVLKINYFNVWRHGNGTDVNASSNSTSYDPQYQLKMKNGLVITAGLPFNTGFSISNLYKGLQTNWSGAGYLQAEYTYKRLSLVGGVRYEITKIDSILEKGAPVFRTGINYKAGKATFLRASWGQGYRLPSIGERFVAQPFGGLYIVPNPTLLTEKSWNMELGIKQGFQIKNWSAFFDFSTFLSQYNHFVEYEIGSYNNISSKGDSIFKGINSGTVFGLQPQNLGGDTSKGLARIFGFEVSLQSQGNIGKVKITTMVGYTYYYPGDLAHDSAQRNLGTFFSNAFSFFDKRIRPDDKTNTNKLLLLRQRHLFRGDIELTYWHISLGGTLYYTSFPEKFGDTYGLALSLLSNGLPDYVKSHIAGDLVGDVRLGYKFNDRFKLYAICKNVGNHFYAMRPGKIDPPRSLTLQLNMSF